jgi:sugar O-acyltransferase (sialic acid O-acetyltransferase NeuD family)
MLCWGNSELARVGEDYLSAAGFDIRAFIVDKEYVKDNEYLGRPVITEPLDTDYKIFLPISYIGLNKVREEKFKLFESLGFTIVGLRHPAAIISNKAIIGRGCWIQEGSAIQSYSEMGNGCVAWAGSHFGHSAKASDFVWLTSGCVVCSSVEIGERTFVGASAILHPSVKVGRDCIIGSGAIITKDLPDFSVAMEGRNNIISKKSWEVKL